MNPPATRNRLGSSLSPYLRQHAGNPVHWQPWDEQALEQARQRKLPILLSVGYAACHWCHVMESECFMDEKIARQMNEFFVCIKVDREERPDLDKAYQLAHYLLTRSSGGWPLTAFLASDLVPFFSGTYFPPTPIGRKTMSFPQVMERASRVWVDHPGEIEQQSQNMIQAIGAIDNPHEAKELNSEVVDRCVEQLSANFDMENGGLGLAPKFPQVPALRCALGLLARGERHLLPGLELALNEMAMGGLQDHVGGGFYRYCVDPEWEIPHFEKMLYDNAQLLDLYAVASVVMDNEAYVDVARRIAGWMLEEMLLPDGGFASALDADSEHAEGKFYVWSRAELEEKLSEQELMILDGHTNSAGAVNFEGGMIHIRLKQQPRLAAIPEELSGVFEKMKEIRSKRIRPSLDDKCVLGNCAMAANALGSAGLLCNEPGWIEQAHKTLSFVEGNMRVDDKYKTVWRNGECSPIPAFLDDYACLLQARVALLQDRCSKGAAKQIAELAAQIEERFSDGEGGLLFSAKDAPQTIRKTRNCDDGPSPSGNGVTAYTLLKLGYVFGETSYLEQARSIINGFSWHLSEAPSHAPTLLLALEEMINPQNCVTLTGSSQALGKWQGQVRKARATGVVVLCISDPSGLPAGLAKPMPDDKDKVAAYVCRAMVCAASVDTPAKMQRLLDGKPAE